VAAQLNERLSHLLGPQLSASGCNIDATSLSNRTGKSTLFTQYPLKLDG
jgi:hypothetical protein